MYAVQRFSSALHPCCMYAVRRFASALHPTTLRGRADFTMLLIATTFLNLYCAAIWHHLFVKLTFRSLPNIAILSV